MATKTAPAAKNNQRKPEQPAKKDALATRDNNTALTKQDLDKLLLQDEGAGSENIGAKDVAIPRLSMLQSNSDQCTKGNEKYIKGAEAGDFFNNITNEVWTTGEDGFKAIFVSYRRANIEWIPKKKGGGFVADHGADDSIFQKTTKNEDGAMMLANGHEVVTTAEYFVIAIHPKTGEQIKAVVSLAKTQLKHARKLNTSISGLMVPRPGGGGKFNPAMFYSVFDVVAMPESNDKGNWMGWDIRRAGDTLELENGQELYMDARRFREVAAAGKVTVAAPVETGSAGTGTPNDGESL